MSKCIAIYKNIYLIFCGTDRAWVGDIFLTFDEIYFIAYESFKLLGSGDVTTPIIETVVFGAPVSSLLRTIGPGGLEKKVSPLDIANGKRNSDYGSSLQQRLEKHKFFVKAKRQSIKKMLGERNWFKIEISDCESFSIPETNLNTIVNQTQGVFNSFL